MNIVILIGWLVLLAAMFLIVHAAKRWRSEAIRSLAIRLGYHYLGRGVPRTLSLRGTPFERAAAIWNLIDGDRPGARVIAFDCRIGYGKQSWRRTVIAVNSANRTLDADAANNGLAVERTDGWLILYRPKGWSLNFGLMPVDELEARLSRL